MRLVGLAVVLVLSLVLASLGAEAQEQGRQQSKEFRGGVTFVERIDQMTDEKLCSVHTPMRSAEAVISRASMAFFVHDRLGPVAREPAPTLRLGQGKAFQLLVTDRPYLIAVPKDRTREAIAALYSQNQVILRWYDLRRDQHTIAIEIGDFSTAYDYAMTTCGFPRLAAKRGTFAPAVPPSSPRAPSPDPTVAVTSNLGAFIDTFYARQVSEKVRAQWEGKAIRGQQPTVVFEIERDGRIGHVVVAETSGNTNYDQIALRAINDASPFPPLPHDYPELSLTVKLQFRFDLDPRSGIEGEPVPLGSTDAAYGEYLDRVRRMIKEKWGYPCEKDLRTGHCDYKSATLVVEFGILKDGHVPYITVTHGTGSRIYDDYAVNAIRLGAPFPPTPRELMARAAPGSAGVRIVATFTYALNESSLTNDLR